MTRNMRRSLALALLAACSAPAAAQSLEWVRQLGTSADDFAYGVAVDGAGGVYIAGWTGGSLGGPRAGNYDAFLAKYDASGALQWKRQLGTPVDDRAHGVAVDGAGGVYIAGRTEGSLGGPSAGNRDAFLAKYDAAGALQWTRQLGTSAGEYADGVAVDGAGDVYITGATGGSLGGPSAGAQDVFLAKYNASGNLEERWVWKRQFGTGLNDEGHGVAVDGAGSVYITGDTLGHPTETRYDAVLAKYDGSGASQWTRTYGTSRDDRCYGVAVDGAGGVYTTGTTDGSLGGPSAGFYDAFLAKHDASGELQWVRQFGSPGSDQASGVAVDGAGGVYITGWTEDDAFLARYDASGALSAWTQQLGTDARDRARCVAVDGAGGVYIAGLTEGDLGGPSAGSNDAFLAKYNYETATCYADCDGSLSLDFFDFLCFQNLFATGDPLADCDGSGVLDFLDFLCFQNEFAAGCL